MRPDNAQEEYYLTDAVGRLRQLAESALRPVVAADHLEVLGINDRVELALARREMNARICAQHMRDGVTIVDPPATYLEPELEIGSDTVIYPNTDDLAPLPYRPRLARSGRMRASRMLAWAIALRFGRASSSTRKRATT